MWRLIDRFPGDILIMHTDRDRLRYLSPVICCVGQVSLKTSHKSNNTVRAGGLAWQGKLIARQIINPHTINNRVHWLMCSSNRRIMLPVWFLPRRKVSRKSSGTMSDAPRRQPERFARMNCINLSLFWLAALPGLIAIIKHAERCSGRGEQTKGSAGMRN